MPRSTRQWAHRKLEESRTNLDWAATHLLHVMNVYNPQHPEIGSAIHAVIDALAAISKTIYDIKRSF